MNHQIITTNELFNHYKKCKTGVTRDDVMS